MVAVVREVAFDNCGYYKLPTTGGLDVKADITIGRVYESGIGKHLSNLHDDLSDRFVDMKQMNFPSWIAQPFLLNWENNDCLAKMESDQIDELMARQNDDSMKPIHASKQHFKWLDPQVVAKYEKIATEAQQVPLPFPTTYLVECALSAVTDMLT
ncbi:uncharacterized protein LOC121872541 [Homarus americanus]|uniref:uncharacterized protein LOC121872541 n=1 Tax=Homarus americanus TaxID=6706 RepID=UPI001C436911|nr:uncharacterized protein LOC121872541 [Homarus americanus]